MRREPTIHFAENSNALERLHHGRALCGAGTATRTDREQYVTGIFDDATCKNCIRIVRAVTAREEHAS